MDFLADTVTDGVNADSFGATRPGCCAHRPWAGLPARWLLVMAAGSTPPTYPGIWVC